MSYKEVSEFEFDILMKESIRLRKCPVCGSLGGRIEILMPGYGRCGVRVVCIDPKCNHSTQLYGYTDLFVSEETHRIGSFTLDKSLLRGINNAVAEYNKESVNI